jgi:acyl carrier protein
MTVILISAGNDPLAPPLGSQLLEQRASKLASSTSFPVEARRPPVRLLRVIDPGQTTELTVDIDGVKAAVVETLGIEERFDTLDAATPLESLPEFDSLAVLELVVELEGRFGISVDDEDVTAEVFGTLGSLAAFVDAKSG